MRLILPAALLATLFMAGCTPPAPQPVAAATPPLPPPMPAETVPKPPPTEELLIWQPGHWDWVGNGYSWRAGKYVQLAGHGTMWQPGYWDTKSGTPVWVPAHWE